jgi:hypothetical protein
MLKAKDLPGVFWGEAVTTAVYLLNRSSSKSIAGKTPYELWTGSTPSVHHLRTFGCVAHVKPTVLHQKKLDDQSKRMIFVRYELGSMAYRAYDPTTRRVHISRDIVFDKAAQWAWSTEEQGEARDFAIEEPGDIDSVVVTTTTSTARDPASASTSPTPLTPATPQASPAQDTAPLRGTPRPASLSQDIEFATPPSVDVDEYLDADHKDDAPLRFRRIDNLIGPSSPPEYADRREAEEHLMLACDIEPASYEEAMKHECWRLAMLDEMTSIEANGTWKCKKRSLEEEEE